MNKELPLPDWSFWGNLHDVQIWQAVALSLNADPASLEMFGGFDPNRCTNLPDGFIERLNLACRNLQPPSMYERYTPPFQRMVGLEEFGIWADNLLPHWDLPDEFPPPPTLIEDEIEDPGSLSSCQQVPSGKDLIRPEAARGVTKAEILGVDWPMPNGAPTLQSILDKLPKWVSPACTKIGQRGKGKSGSHLWNPAVLAGCLAVTAQNKQWVCNKQALTKLIRNSFSEYLSDAEAQLEDI